MDLLNALQAQAAFNAYTGYSAIAYTSLSVPSYTRGPRPGVVPGWPGTCEKKKDGDQLEI